MHEDRCQNKGGSLRERIEAVLEEFEVCALSSVQRELADTIIAAISADGEPVALSVWFGSMPESNGKTNWTAILHRGDIAEGHTIDRSEYKDRVRYEADRVRYLLGAIDAAPWILDYDADLHSGYVEPVAHPATDAAKDAQDQLRRIPDEVFERCAMLGEKVVMWVDRHDGIDIPTFACIAGGTAEMEVSRLHQETALLRQQLADTEAQRNASNREIERLRDELAAATLASRLRTIEECAKVCADISEAYRVKEGDEWPEGKTDAEDGATECAGAIRKLEPAK